MRFFGFGCLYLLLAGCQTAQYRLYPAPPLIAYSSDQTRSIASQAAGVAHTQAQTIDPAQYPFFRDNSFGRNWLSKPNHKVITIGYPKRCATYNSRWKHSRTYIAVERTLATCLSRVKELGKHIGTSCGCRVAAIDNMILMSPDELPFRKNIPAIALVKDESGRKEILGYVETTGRTGQNQPLNFYTQSDRKVCQGHYNLGTLSVRGDAQLDCFNGRIKGPARFRVAGFREGQAYGTALVNAGENQLILVYGLPSDEFQKRRAELLNE